jgi:hypothetical protein
MGYSGLAAPELYFAFRVELVSFLGLGPCGSHPCSNPHRSLRIVHPLSYCVFVIIMLSDLVMVQFKFEK